ncbi:UNVERIFIED_CONTAM: hypothetical protein Sangu_1811700 [Sesamum angustifolium]|uniref:Ty1-copia retrotransposon protein n=1 Tax=Sesamum angustifolium TaxID=2727405 RepID=A0AAW2M824_9LAMI
MTNTLFDLFVNHKSARTIWSTLESRYGGDDAGRKKYVVGKWLQFQIVDGKSIMDQVHEYENIVADVLNEDMKMCEILQANVLLEKFHPSWNDYRNHLKHKKRDLTLQELISHMRTEEANRLKDKEISNYSFSIKANLVEPSESSKDRFQRKGQKFKKNVQQKSHKGNDGKIQRTNVNAIVVENGTQSLSVLPTKGPTEDQSKTESSTQSCRNRRNNSSSSRGGKLGGE